MNLRQLKTFVAIGETGGFARAEGQLQVTQSAASRWCPQVPRHRPEWRCGSGSAPILSISKTITRWGSVRLRSFRNFSVQTGFVDKLGQFAASLEGNPCVPKVCKFFGDSGPGIRNLAGRCPPSARADGHRRHLRPGDLSPGRYAFRCGAGRAPAPPVPDQQQHQLSHDFRLRDE